MIYYFAYGSNMDQAQMSERCPESHLVGKAILDDYRIGFTIYSPKRECGCADVIKTDGEQVCGLLYEISESDRESLDKAEGHPNNYRRFTVVVRDDSGKTYGAESYQVVDKKDFLKPSKHYLGMMLNAAKRFEFPATYVDFLSAVDTKD